MTSESSRPESAAAATSDRLSAALAAREAAGADFFGGWHPDDVALLARWAVDPDELDRQPGMLVDWLGCRTDRGNYAQLPLPDEGTVVAGVPVPHDTIHADAIEYVALLTAVERAGAAGRGELVVLELGASYAPWAVHAGLLGRRAGFPRIVLTAVEASEPAIARIHAHATLNGLTDDPAVELRAVHAAVAPRRGSIYFPVVDTTRDNGAQATRTRRARDYRGQALEHVKVPAVTLRQLTADLERVDFAHLDLQGGERALLEDRRTVRCLTEKVATLMLATHSRLIEGIALERLGDAGWRLVRERPTGFVQNEATSDVVGWTTHDGAQLWTNPRFDRAQ